MSDYNSSLPIRTENNGDAAVKVVDGTTPSQTLAVDTGGRVTVKLDDGSGVAVTSQASGAQRALDVGIAVAGTQVDPRQTRALTSADVVTANQGTAAAVAGAWPIKLTDGTNVAALTAAGEQKVDVTQPLPAGTNIIGKVELTDGTNTASVTAAGEVKVDVTQPLPAGTNLLGSVNARINDATGTAFSQANPLPVTLAASSGGTQVNDYNTAAALGAGATSNHDYAITASKTFYGKKFWATASGKLKVEVQISADGITFATKWVGFNSTAIPNISIDLDLITVPETGTGSKIRIIRTNEDKAAMDVYSTISGTES